MSVAERASKASRAEQAQQVSGASEQVNGRASGPVLQSVFLAVINHSVLGFFPSVVVVFLFVVTPWFRTTENSDVWIGPLAHPLHRLLICLLHNACFAHTLYCTHSRSLTPKLVGQRMTNAVVSGCTES